MKIKSLILVFIALATLASAQLRTPYGWSFPLDSLTNTDTLIYTVMPTDKFREFKNNYDIAGYIKKTEATGNPMGTIAIREKFTSAGDYVTIKTYSFDTTKTTENILIQHTTRGLATKIEIYSSGTGKAYVNNFELIAWLRAYGLWWATNQ